MQSSTESHIEHWLRELSKINDNGCHSPTFWKPYHLVTAGLAMKKAGKDSFTLPDEFQSYAARMKLWDSVGMVPPAVVNERPSKGRFLPVYKFNRSIRSVNEVAEKLADVVKATSTEYQDSISGCLQELVSNFFDHANSDVELPCLVAAQSWPKGGLVQVAIADSGIGIRGSLNENPDLAIELSCGNACEISSKYGVSSKLNNGHSGYGLTLAKDLMKQANGRYILVSGHEIFRSSSTSDKSLALEYPWEGTLLILEWKMDNPLNSTEVYNGWPKAEGFDEDDFF